MSIIDPKYRERKDPDWIGHFVDGQVKAPVMKTVDVKDAEGNVTGKTEVETKETRIDLDRLFALAAVNAINADKFKEQVDRKNAPGRIRMSVGNMLRAAARRRHGLYSIDGTWHEAPAELIDGKAKSENPDGTRVIVAKPAAEAEPIAAE